MANVDDKKRVEKFGVPDCDHIRCPKLDPVLKSTLPNEAIKADGFLSQLHQFWLDAVAPLSTVLESAESGERRNNGSSVGTAPNGECAPEDGPREPQKGAATAEPRSQVTGRGRDSLQDCGTYAIWGGIRKTCHG